MTSTGDYTMGNLAPLGNKENSDDFCGELTKRIFILLGSNKNSVGKKAYCWGVGSGVCVVCHSTGGIILGWGETKVNCYLVDFQTSRQLVGEFGETEWSPLGVDSWKFDFAGEESFISAEDLQFKIFGSAGDWEFEVLTLMGIKGLKL